MTAPVETTPMPPGELRLFQELLAKLSLELKKVFVGQDDALACLLAALAADGHVLLEGVPGLGKTLLARSLARTLGLKFSRIQFTPDLMPADITGGLALLNDEKGVPRLKFQPGPLLADFVLADEINRATPKTQAALLEAMQERQVSTGGQSVALPASFTVIATQNPVEQEGTYPLPEAELDRFMVKILLKYPEEEDYFKILDKTAGSDSFEISEICGAESLLALRRTLRKALAPRQAQGYAVRLCIATQPGSKYAGAETASYVQLGAGPRAAQSLILLAKAFALMDGRAAIGCSDLRRAAYPALRHRLVLNFEAKLGKVSADSVIEKILARLPE